MTDKNVNLLKRQLCSSRQKHVYNALQEIRTRYMKEDNKKRKILEADLIPHFINILRKYGDLTDQTNVKLVDITLSILGNLCMNTSAAYKVQCSHGIQVLSNILCSSDQKSIQNRSSRCLANVAINPNTDTAIHSTDAVRRIVELLKDSEDTECQATYIRAIRLLSYSKAQYVNSLLETNAVTVVMSHLSSESEHVQRCAFRCISSLASIACSSNLAHQIIFSDNLQHLLTFINYNDKDIAERAVTLIHDLLSLNNFRPYFGSQGGIQLFLDYLKKDNLPTYHMKIISGLCLCCKDAVNRVRLRETGALIELLQFLNGKEYVILYDRLVSALICFIYDRNSFNILVDNGMVGILLRKLRWYMELPEVVLELGCISSLGYEPKQSNDVGNTLLENTGKSLSEKYFDPTLNVDRIHKESEVKSDLEKVETISDPEKLETTVKIDTTEEEDMESSQSNTKENIKRPVYSIDSPTYGASSTSHDNLFSEGPTCKTSFTPPYSYESYSPMSNQSYNSPSYSSTGSCSSGTPPFSPERSDLSSPEVHVFSPMSGGLSSDIESVYSEVDKSPSWSPDYDQSSSESLFSETAADTVKEMEPSEHNADGEVKTYASKIVTDQTYSIATNVDSTDEGYLLRYYYKNVKDTPKRKCMGRRSLDFEKNILILLTHVFHVISQNQVLVTPVTLISLLDYMALVDRPWARCGRLLSCIIKCPLCVEICFQLHLPVLLYWKLLEDKNVHHFLINGRNRSRNRSPLPDGNLYKNVSQPRKRRRIIERRSEEWSDNVSEGQFSCSSDMEDAHSHEREGKVCEPLECGLSLLRDFSQMVQMFYCQRVVQNLWSCGNDEQRLRLSVSLMFVLWTPNSRSYYFKMQVLDKVLDLLEQGGESLLFSTAVQGLSLLAKVIVRTKQLTSAELIAIFESHRKTEFSDQSLHYNNLTEKLKLPCENDESGSQSVKCETKTDDVGKLTCAIVEDDCDVIFVVEATKLHGRRAALTEKSEFFGAMLTGEYKEAKLSEIKLENTSMKAFQFILHYLHGCDATCSVVGDLLEGDVSMETTDLCVSLFVEADKFCLNSLKAIVIQMLQYRFISPDSALKLFEHSVLNDCSILQTAAVTSVLVSDQSNSKTVSDFKSFLASKYSSVFLQIVSDLFSV